MHSNRISFIPLPPPLKTTLSTTVDAFEATAYDLPLSSKLGKRRLFRKRVWAESLGDGFEAVRFMPDWMITLPSGRQAYYQMDVIKVGTLDAFLDEVQEKYGVHLWMAPIKYPATYPRGNWWWPGVCWSTFTLADVLHDWRGELKAARGWR